MEDYSNLIIFLVVLAFLGLRLVKGMKERARLRDRRGTVEKSLELVRDQAYKTGQRRNSRDPAGMLWGEQTLENATENRMRTRVSETMRPEGREVPPVESTLEQTGAPAGETATELRKTPSSTTSRLFQDSNDLRKAVIWAEVLRRPGPRKLR